MLCQVQTFKNYNYDIKKKVQNFSQGFTQSEISKGNITNTMLS